MQMRLLSVQEVMDIFEMPEMEQRPNVVARALDKTISEVMAMPHKEYRKCLAVALAENGLDE